MLRLLAGLAAAVVAFASAPSWAQTSERTLLPAIMTGDEPIAVTRHTIQTPEGPLTYEARTGRLAIRADETGEVRGYAFFTAYVVKNRGDNRPLTIAWNGGPTVASVYVHTEFLGPRRVTPTGMVDNPQTLLRTSDLVFYDPIETGFSRVAKPEFAPEFFNMKGDVAVAAEFIRAYRVKFGAETQPLFLLGESYGVWRAGAVADALTGAGVAPAGVILVSGGFPSIKMPPAFWNAWNVPTRTATALYYKRLPADLQKNPAATLAKVRRWIADTYLPALEHPERLSPADRARLIAELALYSGMKPEQVDPDTLVISTLPFLERFFDGDKERVLADVDTRQFGDEKQPPGRYVALSRYFRQELGYDSSLGYTGALGLDYDLGYRALEAGYVPTPGPARRSSGKQWTYNQTEGAAAASAAGRKDGEVWHMFNENPPWMQNAMGRAPRLRAFVAMGLYDPTNSCDGVSHAVATLPADQADRVTVRCYDGGHMMFRDDDQRARLLDDLRQFEANALRP